MKSFLIIALSFYTFNIYAVEFYQCVDNKGQQHFTNLPAASLDSNCRPRTDRYAYMLNQDYSAIESYYKRYSQTETTEDDEDILDADNALNDMLERSNDQPENSATETFNARSKAVELILSEERPGNSVVLP